MKDINEIMKASDKVAQRHRKLARYYNLNSILGNTWAIFFGIIGPRKTGKSYAVADYICSQKKKKKDQCKVYWMRISETSTKAMLANKADKLIDPDLKRIYNLDFTTKGMDVYDHYDKNKKDQTPFMTLTPLSQFGKLKGVGFYDKDYQGDYILVLDEFQLEQGEKRTSFDILYNFIGMCENIARTTKAKIKVFLLGNTLEEASTVLKAFEFIPEKFGRFYLKSKKCVIDNLEPTEEYLEDRKGSIADILGGNNMSNYSNSLNKDTSLIKKERVKKPIGIIKFTKQKNNWYTLWEGMIVKRYNNEKLAPGTDFTMRRYLDSIYNPEKAQTILDLYDSRSLYFDSLITQAYFQEDLTKIKK